MEMEMGSRKWRLRCNDDVIWCVWNGRDGINDVDMGYRLAWALRLGDIFIGLWLLERQGRNYLSYYIWLASSAWH